MTKDQGSLADINRRRGGQELSDCSICPKCVDRKLRPHYRGLLSETAGSRCMYLHIQQVHKLTESGTSMHSGNVSTYPADLGYHAQSDNGSLDTAGTEQFTAMRELYMKQGQGFLLVFSITSMSSLHELAELREQIIRIKDDENIPIVIVGNKSDLEDARAVSRTRAYQLSQHWGNAPYYETSARRRANVDEVFIDLCRQIIRKDMHMVHVRDQEMELRRREKPNRHDRRRGRRMRQRDRCVIL